MPPLPPSLQFVKRLPEKVQVQLANTGGVQSQTNLRVRAILPNYLVRTAHEAAVESDVYVTLKMARAVTIVRRPFGITLGPGVEIVSRPCGMALPEGMKIVIDERIPTVLKGPTGLLMREGLELVQLEPRIDLPSSCVLDGCWHAYPRPCGVRLPPNVALFRYEKKADTDPDADADADVGKSKSYKSLDQIMMSGIVSAGMLPSYLRAGKSKYNLQP